MGEESIQPIKHANKIIVSILFTIKATILDTRGIFYLLIKDFVEFLEVFGIQNDHFEIVINVDLDQCLDHSLDNANQINL
jgi:hypothetical protein